MWGVIPLAVKSLYQAEPQYALLRDQRSKRWGSAGETGRSTSCTETHTVEGPSPQRKGKPVMGTEGSPELSPMCSGRAGGSLAVRHAVPSPLGLSEASLRSGLIAAGKCLHGDKIPGTKGLFNLAVKDRPRTSSWKQKPRELYLEKRQVVKGGDGVPRLDKPPPAEELD